MILAKTMRFLLLAVLVLGMRANLALATEGGITNTQVKQVTKQSVVVEWDTPKPASSKLRYTSQLLGQFATPDYASVTIHHQMLLTGLQPGEDYQFIPESIDSEGTSYIGAPVNYRILTDGSIPDEYTAPQESSSPTTFRSLFQVESLSLVPILQEAQSYALARSHSTGFGLLAAFLSFVIFLLEQASWSLVVCWIIAYASLQLWHARNHKPYFMVIDSETNQPIPSAIVTVLQNNQVIATLQSNKYGQVFFGWPTEQAVTIQVGHKGYRTATHIFVNEIFDIALDPMSASLHGEGGMRIAFLIRHSLKLIHLIALIGGSVFALYSVIILHNFLSVVTLFLYMLLWFIFFTITPRRYNLAQVTDGLTHAPIPNVHVDLNYNGRRRHVTTDQYGFLTLYHPLPPMVTLSKNGFQQVADQSIPSPAPIGLLVFKMNQQRL